MNSSAPNPRLPAWIFIATDLALIGAAAFIAAQSAQPLSMNATIAIVACVGLGTIIGLVPLVARYERQKNETLDERQRALEALARTVSSSAEQIGIAAAGLHELVELAQKNVRHAEQLPHKLQEKIAEFQAQMAVAVDAEKEELERELLALRTSESDRLETVSQRIAKSAADWTKLEATAQQHLAAANEALAKLGAGTAAAITKAQAEAARVVGEAAAAATKAIESAKSAALVDLNSALAAASATVVERFTTTLAARLASATRELDDSITRLEATTSPRAPDSAPPSGPAESASSPAGEAVAPPAKRPRKPRRDESAADATATAQSTPPAARADEPPPIPATAIPEVTPVAPSTAEPFSGHIAVPPAPAPSAPPSPVAPPTEAAVDGDGPRPARKRSARKPAPEEEQPALGLDASALGSAASVAERVISSDGATRLLVTAYIGIGNRLFIRGEGPGLSWEKGVPLQFVSIGKWRWETNDANAPVRFKLYKNDEVECPALGAQALEPGNQLEVTAAF